MTELNPQRPFSFQCTPKRLWESPRPRFNKPFLSRNIVGLCPQCGKSFQKLRKYSKEGPNGIPRAKKLGKVLCPVCLKHGYEIDVVEFNKALFPTLFPWRIHKEPDFDFTCGACAKRFCSWALFGTCCNHKTHRGNNRLVCRLCCTKVVEQVKTIESKQAKESNKKSGINIFWGDIALAQLPPIGWEFGVPGIQDPAPAINDYFEPQIPEDYHDGYEGEPF